jgi:hypothetical protein
MINGAETSAIPISIPKSPTVSIYRTAYGAVERHCAAVEINCTVSVEIGSRLSLRGRYRESDAEERGSNDQTVPGQHGHFSQV